MALEIVSPLVTFIIVVFALSVSIGPAFYFVNRYLREEPHGWNKTRAVGVMLFSGSLFAGLLTVNGVVSTSYDLLSLPVLVTFIMVLATALVGMVVVGMVLAYPLHRFLSWQEPPEIIKRYQP